jgi:formylglycine-generating enzyme required for sulfatase activity
MLRALLAFTLCSVLCVGLSAQSPEAKRLALAEEAAGKAREALTSTYEMLEAELKAGAKALAGRVSAELQPIVATWRDAPAPQVVKLLAEGRKKIQALVKHENPCLAELAPWLAQRFGNLVQERGASLAKDEAGALAQTLLAPLREARAFHELWNADLSALVPAAENYRKAVAEVENSQEAVESAKDPARVFRRGAPAGFARIPAGNYGTLFSGGFAGQGVRKKDKSFVLDHDLFLALDEVTQADYLAWLLTLSAEDQLLHQPREENGKARWEAEQGTGVLALIPGTEKLPVTGITLASAATYANAKGARLPTEEEWCAAAAGKDRWAYPWGARYEKGRCNDRDGGAGDLAPVGSFANGRGPFGHNDLSGNAAEWTITLESGKVLEFGVVAQENAVVRGGSFKNSGTDVSTGWVWFKRAVGDRDLETGFRLLIDPAAKTR